MLSLAFVLLSFASPPNIDVYVLPNCHWCDKLKETLADPRVKAAVGEIKFIPYSSANPPTWAYPHVVVGSRSFEGYKSPTDLLEWLK